MMSLCLSLALSLSVFFWCVSVSVWGKKEEIVPHPFEKAVCHCLLCTICTCNLKHPTTTNVSMLLVKTTCFDAVCRAAVPQADLNMTRRAHRQFYSSWTWPTALWLFLHG